jgi:hypothetical protein
MNAKLSLMVDVPEAALQGLKGQFNAAGFTIVKTAQQSSGLWSIAASKCVQSPADSDGENENDHK